MQVFGLPRQVTRGAKLASRPGDAERSGAAPRRDAVERWNRARNEHGMTAADAARIIGVSRATLYRWQHRPVPGSRRPNSLRQPRWTPGLSEKIRPLRNEYPMEGKVKIAIRLRREGIRTSVSTVGRILGSLIRKGTIQPVPVQRRNAAPAPRRAPRNHARRLPKGHRPTVPGETIQIDTMHINRGNARRTIKHFTAADPVSKWTCAMACSRATATNAVRFLEQILRAAPFPLQAIQVDGGSEFRAAFEEACKQLGITLYVLPPKSPKLNAHVERCNGTWRYEFYNVWDLPDDIAGISSWVDAFAEEFNIDRPHQNLGYATPIEYLAANPPPRSPQASHIY